MRLLYILFSLLFIVSCNSNNTNLKTDGSKSLEYATGIKINECDNYVHITINDPWNEAKVLATYILIDKNEEIPENLPSGVIIKTPIEKVIVYNSPQCNALDYLGVISTVKGVCEPEYITNEYIRNGVDLGEIVNLGMASSPDIEKIIDLNPELIIAPGFQNNSYSVLSKTGIPIIQCVDYMEQYPLGNSEWIKLYGLLFDKTSIADSIFNSLSFNYNKLKDIASQYEYKPRLLTERRYNNVWYLPGNNSFAANLYRDAGAELAINDNNLTGSLSLSTEEVLDKAGDADIWLIKYYGEKEMTYEDLKNDYFLYSHFDAWKNRNIYICNTLYQSYYETLPLHPDIILKDLIKIFHPEVMIDFPDIFEHEVNTFFRHMSK